MDQATREAVRAAFWALFALALIAALISIAATRRRCIARATLAMVLALASAFAIETAQGGPLVWWQQLGVDFAAFVLITLPPRHYWQTAMGALVFAQLWLHGFLALEALAPRDHWLFMTLIEMTKCLILIGWAGGKRVETVLGRAARIPARLVLAAPDREPA